VVPEDRIKNLCDQLSVEKDSTRLQELLCELKVSLREYSLKLQDMMVFHLRHGSKYKDTKHREQKDLEKKLKKSA
jgi:hypothetical protein